MNTPASGLSMFRVARQRLLGAKKAPGLKWGPASYKARPLLAKGGIESGGFFVLFYKEFKFLFLAYI
jgi:hypothetical protein